MYCRTLRCHPLRSRVLITNNLPGKPSPTLVTENLYIKLNLPPLSSFQVDALRLRLEEKESFLNKKTKQLQDLTEEKGTLAGEIRDMKDMLEVKERKINVLQKKVSS